MSDIVEQVEKIIDSNDTETVVQTNTETVVQTNTDDKQKVKPPPKTIVVCIPGRDYSNNFLLCWSNLINYCNWVGHKLIISNSYSPNIYYVRNECLGANTLDGVLQKPFRGKVEYDYMFWIDSDVLFNVEDFQALIDMDKDVACGCYIMADNKHFAIVEKMNHKYYKENGTYQFLTREDIEKKNGSFPVDYTGFGFLCMKYGVMESLQYPFFKPRLHEFNINGKIVKDYSSEDVSWCMDVRDQGYEIYCNPKIRLGHEKRIVLA